MILEALRAGRFGIGSDISPLALFVARGRTWTASDSALEELREVCVGMFVYKCKGTTSSFGQLYGAFTSFAGKRASVRSEGPCF